MDTALKNTIWPSLAVSDNVKILIGKFFTIVDVPDPDSGRQLAEEIFAENGVMATATDKSIGSEGAYYIAHDNFGIRK